MKLIAHRGLISGPDPKLENKPEQISSALIQGFDAEVDVWYIGDCWWVGHDAPTYQVTDDFLHQHGLWLHAKNLGALYILSQTKLIYFWHQNDDFTVTSNGYIWTYPGQPLTPNSVMVMPECEDSTLVMARSAKCHAICSDYVEKLK